MNSRSGTFCVLPWLCFCLCFWFGSYALAREPSQLVDPQQTVSVDLIEINTCWRIDANDRPVVQFVQAIFWRRGHGSRRSVAPIQVAAWRFIKSDVRLCAGGVQWSDGGRVWRVHGPICYTHTHVDDDPERADQHHVRTRDRMGLGFRDE